MNNEEDGQQPVRVNEQQLIPGMPGIYEVAGISVQELVNNETALKLVIHTFRQTVDDNVALKQQQNFDKSEIAKLNRENRDKTIGTMFTFTSSIPIGFGINILTSNSNPNAGWACLIVGFLLWLGGMILSLLSSQLKWPSK